MVLVKSGACLLSFNYVDNQAVLIENYPKETERKFEMILFRIRYGLLIFTLLIIVFLASCGTVSVDLHTKVQPSGDFTQQVKIEGTEMMGNLVVSQEIIQKFKREGWEVDTSRSGNTASLVATKDFEEGEDVVIPSFSEDSSDFSFKNEVFYIKDRFVFKEYYYEVTIPETPLDAIAGNDEFATLGLAVLQSMFNMSWTLDLPGKIVETNADKYGDESATWYFDIESLTRDRYLTVHTKYINWAVIGAIVGVIVVGLILFVAVKRRRRVM